MPTKKKPARKTVKKVAKKKMVKKHGSCCGCCG